MLAWAVRYVFFAFGNANELVLLLLIGIALHGVCYDFFFVSGQIFTDSKAGDRVQELGAGHDHAGHIRPRHADRPSRPQARSRICTLDAGLHDWRIIWLCPAGFAALIFVLFALTFGNVTVEYRKPPG